jgi:hypothetical protein
MEILNLSLLLLIAISCLFIAYKQFQKPIQQKNHSEKKQKKKQTTFNTNTVTVKKVKNGFTILKFTNQIEKNLESTNPITEVNICIEHIQSYRIYYIEPYRPSMSNTDCSDPEPAKLSLFIAISGIEYQLTNKDYNLIKKVREEFESHYLVE